MKNSILYMSSILMLTVTVIIGCQSSATKVENAEDKVQEAKQDSISEFMQFKKDAEMKIIAQEKNISDFKARIANEKKENKSEYDKKIAELEQKNTDLKKKLADLKDDSQNTWISFKNEFNHDMDELGHAFKDLTVNNTQ